jgi:hypothetical protein
VLIDLIMTTTETTDEMPDWKREEYEKHLAHYQEQNQRFNRGWSEADCERWARRDADLLTKPPPKPRGPKAPKEPATRGPGRPPGTDGGRPTKIWVSLSIGETLELDAARPPDMAFATWIREAALSWSRHLREEPAPTPARSPRSAPETPELPKRRGRPPKDPNVPRGTIAPSAEENESSPSPRAPVARAYSDDELLAPFERATPDDTSEVVAARVALVATLRGNDGADKIRAARLALKLAQTIAGDSLYPSAEKCADLRAQLRDAQTVNDAEEVAALTRRLAAAEDVLTRVRGEAGAK